MPCPAGSGDRFGGGGVTAREAILSAIRSAQERHLPGETAEVRLPEIGDPLATFTERFERAGGELIALDEAIALVKNSAAVKDADVDWPVHGQPDIWSAQIGITTARALIAETGSILVDSGEGRTRLASLVPEIHLVLARRSQVVPRLEEAIALLGKRNAALITGPSRTADIEGILVRGVHGPKRLLLAWQD
jgi:L-lactate utilization protein LutC